MKFVKYELQVTGHLWGGGWGEYTYALPANTERHPKTLIKCKPMCGDFETLDAATVIKTETIITTSERPILHNF